MKVCPDCGALYLVMAYNWGCKACEGPYDESGDGQHITSLRDLTPEERKGLWHWLAKYEEDDGR